MEMYIAPLIILAGLLVVFAFAVFKASKYRYICTVCKKETKVNPLVAALAPHSQGKKYLFCPNCRTKRLFFLTNKG